MATEKLRQVFEFLREFSTIQNPVVRKIEDYPFAVFLKDVPMHPDISVTIRQGTSESDDFVLRVHRPKITTPPPIPKSLREWAVQSQEPNRPPIHRDAINRLEDDETETIRFDEDAERIAEWNGWYAAWNAWADAERPTRVADRFFQKIYAIHATLQRESESFELVLADGILSCPEVGIHQAVVTQKATVEFAPQDAEFTFRVTDAEAELSTSLLWLLPEVNPNEIVRSNKALSEQGLSPSDPDGLKPFLAGLRMVVPFGVFDENGEHGDARVSVISSPVLILRKRSGGFNQAIQGIIEAIPTLDELPPALLQICGLSNPQLQDEGEPDEQQGPASHYGNEQESVLFSKPANREQLQIVQRLNRHGTVIVQGPPGTGKSYTIGNVIGHLLAKGERILVTAHTTKALQVVRDQVVEPLRPLCVPALGDDAKAHADMEKSVASILEHLSQDPKQLRREAAQLSAERIKLLTQLKEMRARALLSRSHEYREVAVAGEAMSPSDAARSVREGNGVHDWIPGEIDDLDLLPVAIADVTELYTTNLLLSPDEEREIALKNPRISDIPSPSRFAELARWLTEAVAAKSDTGLEFWDREPDESDEEILARIESCYLTAKDLLCGEAWKSSVIAECMASLDQRTKWTETVRAIRRLESEAHELARITAEHGPELENHDKLSEEDILTCLSEIEKHIRERGTIGSLTLLFKPRWKAVLGVCKVNGSTPRNADEVGALRKFIEVRSLRRRVLMRWNRTLVPLGGPTRDLLGQNPEQILGSYATAIDALIGWHENQLRELTSLLATAGFNWDRFEATIPEEFSENAALNRIRQAITERLPPVVSARISALKRDVAFNEASAAIQEIRNVVQSGGASRISASLLSAAEDLDIDGFRVAHEALSELERKEAVYTRRASLLRDLENVAPGWAHAVRHRVPPHDLGTAPGDPRLAWRWTRLRNELSRRDKDVPKNIESTIDSLSNRLFELTSEVAAKLAWASQLESLEGKPEAKMALRGWQQTIQRLGRGTGPAAARRRKEARAEMRMAKGAVPVWIMPMKKVMESFDPVASRFDTIIIDEASQCDLMGLVALFMAKKVIVVGDHEQVSPEAVGMKEDDFQRIIHTNLEGIPQAHLWDGKASIYGFAERAFSGAIMLREHFRCDPKIIAFSNRLCYQGKVVPLRDTTLVPTKPPLVPHKVDGVCIGKVNDIEARTIVSLIAACLERPEYQFHADGSPVTFGVISLMGTEQASHVTSLLTKHLDLTTIEQHRIVCGNPAQFQGDERDVIFLSLVDSPAHGPLAMRQQDLFKKRFNVAASRARNQAWLIYSLDPQNDLQSGDLRRRLIEHFLDPDAVEERIQEAEELTESEFERRVVRRLVGEGYRVTPQWKVGQYRIDLVIEGEGARLAVELDGDKYHPIERIGDDLERQSMLERAGWVFAPRIRGSQFFRDEDAALEPLYQKLEELDIGPSSGAIGTFQENPITEKIRSRAEILLGDWYGTRIEPVDHSESFSAVGSSTSLENGLDGNSEPRENIEPPQPPASIMGRPFTLERFAAQAGRSLNDIQQIAWRSAFWAGESTESIPTRSAKKIADQLNLTLEI